MSGNSTLLVTGASGHLGRRVLELLLEAQTGQIIAATRTPEKLADFAARGVTVRKADFDDKASLVEAFAGADRLLLISTNSLGTPGHRIQQHTNAIKAAEEAGVSHVVYTSLINPEPGTPIAIAPDHYGTEQALTQSKLGFTVLRNNIYTDMLPATLQRALSTGVLASATGDGKAAYVTREDCARVAAAALASSFVGRRTLDITGPSAHSYSELATLASEIGEKPVTFVPLTLDVLIGHMVEAGLPRPLAEMYASFDAGIAQDELSAVSSAFEELTGRKPTSVTEFLTTQREALLPVN